MSNIKAIVYGVGEMGKIMTKLMVEKGVLIVGAVDVSNIGEDLGEVAGLGYALNVKISDNADAVLSAQQADIAIVAVFTEMERIYPHLKKCIENDLNVITTSEEALYPWTTSPELTAKLDKLGREHKVTVTGGGYQDGFLVNLVSVLTGASHKIELVSGKQSFNIDDYGPVVAEHRFVGQTKEEFECLAAERATKSSFLRMEIEALIADLGLSVSGILQFIYPTIDDIDIECKALGKRIIKKGDVTGTAEVVEIETLQGIKFRSELIGKVYRPGEGDISEWHIEGVPELYLKSDKVPTMMATCTQMVNRIPDVINADPGFITVEKLPKLKYRAYPLHFYLQKR